MEQSHARSFWSVVSRRRWIAIATVLVVFGSTVAVSFLRTPIYEATAVMVREGGSAVATLLGGQSLRWDDVQRDLVTTAQIMTSERVAVIVGQELGLAYTAEEMLDMVSATPSADANSITVRVVSPSAAEAAQIANAFCSELIRLLKDDNLATLVDARRALETQYSLMAAAERETERGAEIRSRIEQFRILEDVQTGGYTLWQPAAAPESPVSPRPLRDSAAGLVAGIVLGLMFAVVIDRADRRLREQSDFEREYGLPILAVVPRVGGRRREGRKDAADVIGLTGNRHATFEAYRRLRSNLQYFEVEKGLRTILIASGLPQEAKTVTAINLALGLALSGAKVVLVDADLRSPSIQDYLGLDRGVGLSTVLAGTVTTENAVKVVKTGAFLPEGGYPPRSRSSQRDQLHKDFLCLTSGPAPPNPAELLASSKMGEVLKGLSSLADYVIVDSAPVLLVADALSIVPLVDGVIIVSRAGSTKIDNARETRSALDRVGARLVGIVISDARVARKGGYQQGYYDQYGN